MSEGKHKRGSSKEKFCAIPGEPCECGNDYRDNCKPPDGWQSSLDFKRMIIRAAATYIFPKTYEAHHILCVTSVSGALVDNDKIDGVAKETVWCINNPDNMMGMPLWGHTVKYYCAISAAGGSVMDDSPPAPPFANIPQHDWDHNSELGYTYEVTSAMKTLAGKVEKADHDYKGNALAGVLNTLSGEFKTTLHTRGSSRNGGTHNGWLQGKADSNPRWYEPFSMASTANLTEKGFPVKDFGAKVAAWIDRIAKGLTGGA